MPDFFSLIIPAFLSGILTFLAPCTLPLVPGYLGFISGASITDLKSGEIGVKKKVLLNGLMYVLGFSLVFVFLGILFSLAGSIFGHYRVWLVRLGGIFIMFFGLYLMRFFDFKIFNFLHSNHNFNFIHKLTPGKASSSFIFGMTFAFGWTPCIGPILGSILILVSSYATVVQGGVLLLIFAFGLGIPFLMLAFFISQASDYIRKLSKYLDAVSFLGGMLLVLIGLLMLIGHFEIFTASFYKIFDVFNFEQSLLDYL